MPLTLVIASFAFAIAMCWHAVKTGQQQFWVWVILFLQPLGGLAYLVIVLLPGLFGGPTARTAAAYLVHGITGPVQVSEAAEGVLLFGAALAV